VKFTLTLSTPSQSAHRRRRMLKTALRHDQLRAVDVREKVQPRPAAAPVARISNSAVGARKMPLGKRREGYSLPVLKFDARIGTFYTQDRVLRDNEWTTEQHDVTEGLVLIIDVKNVQQGWFAFPKGGPPQMILAAPDATDIGERPGEEYKEGIRLLVKIPDDAAGTRELISTALGFYVGLDELHDKYVAEKDEHPDKVPLCELVKCREKKLASAPTWEPVFEIIDWVERPDDLPLMPRGPQPPKPNPKGENAKRGDMDDEIPF
jgi:hypothetical protein